MKTSLFSSAVIVAASFFLFSCSQSNNPVVSATDDNSTNSATEGGKGNHISTVANPKICATTGYQIGNDATWQAIAVMNADGANLTRIAAGHNVLSCCTWSSDGSAISYIDNTGGTFIKKINVSIVNNVPTASTPVTVCSSVASDSSTILTQAWSSVGNEIAYGKWQTNASIPTANRTMKLYVMPSNGGTPTLLYSFTGGIFRSLTWSPDGTKLAFISYTTPSTFSLNVILRSNGSLFASYPLSLYPAYNKGLDWSHGTSNKLIFMGKPTSASTNQYIYSFDLDQTNPAPVAMNIPVSEKPWHAAWAGDNSSIVYMSQSATTNLVHSFNVATNAVTAFTGLSGSISLQYCYLQYKH